MTITIRKGNFWESGEYDNDKNCIVAIPANNVINRGNLVMGAGFAKQAKDIWSFLPEMAGQAVSGCVARDGFYGFAFIKGTRIALFQSKYHYSEPSSDELIIRSVKKMLEVIESEKVLVDFDSTYNKTGKVRFSKIHIPLPGIGLGGLDRDDVVALLDEFLGDDDRFVFWEL